MGDKTKKSTYNADVQKKYNAKRKRCGLTLFNDDYNKMIDHMEKRGFTSVNAYLLALVRADMSTAAEAVGAAPAPDDTPDC